MPITSFTQLDVWKKAHQATLEIYRITRGFPDDERYGLSSQMRRASVSIGGNIAEGFGRMKPPDKARFYTISQGSAEELRYYLILAKDLDYLKNGTALSATLDDVCRMLRRLIQSTVRDS